MKLPVVTIASCEGGHTQYIIYIFFGRESFGEGYWVLQVPSGAYWCNTCQPSLHCMWYCWWLKSGDHQLRLVAYPIFWVSMGFIHPRWCKISAINTSSPIAPQTAPPAKPMSPEIRRSSCALNFKFACLRSPKQQSLATLNIERMFKESLKYTLPETNIAHENPHLSW